MEGLTGISFNTTSQQKLDCQYGEYVPAGGAGTLTGCIESLCAEVPGKLSAKWTSSMK
jgi:hypothetical protein